MPFATLNGIKLHYQLDGDASLPVLAFSTSPGTSLSTSVSQLDELIQHFRVRPYDTPRHGN
ncbi:3-oxoadipate enol-lactonase, partial [Herbaspirillum sp. VT-16-41]